MRSFSEDSLSNYCLIELMQLSDKSSVEVLNDIEALQKLRPEESLTNIIKEYRSFLKDKTNKV